MSAADLLDDAEATVATVAVPWLGLLWATALPLRLLQAHFLLRLGELGIAAGEYGHHLAKLSLALAAATVVWVWGRAVFVRACRRAGRSETTGGDRDLDPLAVPPGQLLALLYLTLAAELLVLALFWTLVALPVACVLAAVAAGCHPYFQRPGPLDPWRQVGRALGGGRALVATLFVVAVGWLVAWLNLVALALFLGWTATAVGDLDAGRWQVLLSPTNPTFLVWLAAGATLVVEPFWLAAASAFVERGRERQSGADLVRRLDDLLASEAAS